MLACGLGTQAHPPSKLKPPGPPKNALKILFASKSVEQKKKQRKHKKAKKSEVFKEELNREWVSKAFPDNNYFPPFPKVMDERQAHYLIPLCSVLLPSVSQRKAFLASTHFAAPSPQWEMPFAPIHCLPIILGLLLKGPKAIP